MTSAAPELPAYVSCLLECFSSSPEREYALIEPVLERYIHIRENRFTDIINVDSCEICQRIDHGSLATYVISPDSDAMLLETPPRKVL